VHQYRFQRRVSIVQITINTDYSNTLKNKKLTHTVSEFQGPKPTIHPTTQHTPTGKPNIKYVKLGPNPITNNDPICRPCIPIPWYELPFLPLCWDWCSGAYIGLLLRWFSMVDVGYV
jgi:hypothetical protein